MQNDNLLKVISINESSGGYVHKARVYLVDRRILESQLRLAYKIVQTLNDLSDAKFVIIENLNATVTVIDKDWEVNTIKNPDLYYSYFDVVNEIKKKDVVISQENFQNECKRQVMESAPEGKIGRSVEIRLGLPKEKLSHKEMLADGTIPDRIYTDRLPSKYYRAEKKVNRDKILELINNNLDKTVFRAICSIYWNQVIALIFWDKETVVGMMLEDFRILPLNFTPEQYEKISNLIGHKIEKTETDEE